MKEIKTTLAVLMAVSFSSQASTDNNLSSITIGVGAQYAPEYVGSNKFDADMAPFFEWTKGSWFLNTEKGLGYIHEFDNGAYIGQTLGYSLGRADDGNSWLQEGSEKLKGMGEIKTAMTTTSTAGWWITPWIGFEGNIVAPLTESQGMQYKAKANLVLFNDDSDTLILSTEGVYGDARFNNTWFGVTDKQSLQSGYKRYKTGNGLVSVDYDLNWQHSFNDTWSAYADMRYTMLENGARNSPIVRKDDYVTFTIGAFYTF